MDIEAINTAMGRFWDVVEDLDSEVAIFAMASVLTSLAGEFEEGSQKLAELMYELEKAKPAPGEPVAG